MIFITVKTPNKTYGVGKERAADLKFVELCAPQIAEIPISDIIIVEKATLPARNVETLQTILDGNRKGLHYEVLSNLGFLEEATAIKYFFNADRVLIGGQKSPSGKKAIQSLVDIYMHIGKVQKKF
jgi:UDPglucose 6-dehydrogenase